MDRDEFMELVYETFADEPDNVLANGIIEAADAYAEHEKAQLFSEGTTSDQHVATDTNVGNNSEIPNSSDCISRQQEIDALDTAIEHYDGIAEECRKKANIERNDYMDMRDDAYEARQLAQWLNELKYLREKIEQLTIQPEKRTEERTETHGVCLDAISRQAAIDVTDSEKVSTNPEHFKSSEKFIKFMDDADISSFGIWQWSNGFNTALVATTIQLKKLPSAQPEQTEMIKEIRKWINSANRGNADYFIVDKIEEIINRYE